MATTYPGESETAALELWGEGRPTMADETGRPGTLESEVYRVPYNGVWRRYAAGVSSLLDRAYLSWSLEGVLPPVQGNPPYRDTDQPFTVSLGNEGEAVEAGEEPLPMPRRSVVALLQCRLHRTGGRRPVWEFQTGRVIVWTTTGTGEHTDFPILEEDGKRLLERWLREYAAECLETDGDQVA